jgi:hypothetical protein
MLIKNIYLTEINKAENLNQKSLVDKWSMFDPQK